MKSFTRTTRRAVLVSCVAGATVVGALGVGAAAFADTSPTPSSSQTAPTPPAAGEGTQAQSGPAQPGPPAGPKDGKHEPHIGGTVLTVSGSTVTVKDRDGFTRTIELADGATVTKDDASSSASAITKGAHVEATGSVASNGTTLNATAVRIGEPPRPDGGRGPGRPGGPKQGGAPTPPSGAPKQGETPTPPSGAPTQGGAPTPPSGAPTEAPTPSTGS